MRTTRRIAIAIIAGGCFSAANAQLFSGPAFFSIAPSTQMGSSLNLLSISNSPVGFIVAGQFRVQVGGGTVFGTLLHYQVKRPLNLTFGSQAMFLSTLLVGFSQPPNGGTFSPTSGLCQTYLEITGQPSNVPLSLVNGAATWNFNVAGPSFTYVSGTDAFLVQDFYLDGSKLTGPPGTWVVDLPAESMMVPEPASVAALAVGVVALWRRRTLLTSCATEVSCRRPPLASSDPADPSNLG